MGILIQDSIETTVGEIENAYVVVSSYKVLKSSYEIQYSIRYFSNKKYWEKTLAKTVNDIGKQPDIPQEATFTSSNVLFSKDGEFIDVSLPSNFVLKPTKLENIKTPIFETQNKETVYPYISFNENGDEITLEKKVTELVAVKTGEKETIEEVIDYKAFKYPTKFIYSHLKKELESLLPGVKLKDE